MGQWGSVELGSNCGWVQDCSSLLLLEPRLQAQYHLGNPLTGKGTGPRAQPNCRSTCKASTHPPLAKASEWPRPLSGKGSTLCPELKAERRKYLLDNHQISHNISNKCTLTHTPYKLTCAIATHPHIQSTGFPDTAGQKFLKFVYYLSCSFMTSRLVYYISN